MANRPDIEKAVARLTNKYGAQKEIRKLPEFLWENELVDSLVVGQYGKGQGLLALTNRRILFIFEGIVSSSSEDFPFEKTSSVQWSSGMLLGSITIFASGNKAEIKSVAKPEGKLFVENARNRLSRPGIDEPPARHRQQPAAQPAAPPVDHMAALRKLAELHQAGILTDHEFHTKKAEILSRI